VTTSASEDVPLTQSEDVVLVRQLVRARMMELGFSLVDQTKMITAASELSRNTIDHGGGGRARLEVLREHDRVGIQLTFSDDGPGIPDIDLALSDGYTSGHGLGFGLGGARRLVNEFDIFTAPGDGTTVTITRWR
jgi:serine/threonine-protein kinase RsbT